MTARVLSVARSADYSFSKPAVAEVRLVAGIGVDGDVHSGVTVKHRSRMAKDPTQPNLRQVHLMHSELLDELNGSGFEVEPGDLGENITTTRLDLLGLARGTRLHFGADAVVEVTGLRNPCVQIDNFRKGLVKAVLDRDEKGELVRKSGVMAIVVQGGSVRPDDPIRVALPEGEQRPLEPV